MEFTIRELAEINEAVEARFEWMKDNPHDFDGNKEAMKSAHRKFTSLGVKLDGSNITPPYKIEIID